MRRPVHAPLRGADDFGQPETAFNICSFWRIDALARIGRSDEAREIFEAMLARRNHAGPAVARTSHPVTGELWGNFPQTYSMVGIINAAVRLSAPWDHDGVFTWPGDLASGTGAPYPRLVADVGGSGAPLRLG